MPWSYPVIMKGNHENEMIISHYTKFRTTSNI